MEWRLGATPPPLRRLGRRSMGRRLSSERRICPLELHQSIVGECAASDRDVCWPVPARRLFRREREHNRGFAAKRVDRTKRNQLVRDILCLATSKVPRPLDLLQQDKRSSNV